MRIHHLLAMFFVLVISGGAQTRENTLLTGTVYDATGAVIVNATVTVSDKIHRFETRTNDDGVFKLSVPANLYVSSDHKFRVAKYDVSVIAHGFERSILTGFKIVPGKMQLDVALDVLVIVNTIETENKNLVRDKDSVRKRNNN